MNILFLTMVPIKEINDSNLYADLMREFVKHGHYVGIVSPAERRLNEETSFKEYGSNSILRVKVGNLQKTNIIEKGISTLMVESQFRNAIKKYYTDKRFDLIIYSIKLLIIFNSFVAENDTLISLFWIPILELIILILLSDSK